ncbi:hypothetical protein KFE25_008218 [Diacronema lutheri]|uniref:Uncharacterized protein n=1 Tax=Diacronema lutheri TaxID=2081491 RepID=A0A8J6CBS2_DIALT|nr:hypothetical protein KFE25_008218 [Diacronema lutheri]
MLGRRSLRAALHATSAPASSEAQERAAGESAGFSVPHHSLHAARHAAPSASAHAPAAEPFCVPIHHSLHAARLAHDDEPAEGGNLEDGKSDGGASGSARREPQISFEPRKRVRSEPEQPEAPCGAKNVAPPDEDGAAVAR